MHFSEYLSAHFRYPYTKQKEHQRLEPVFDCIVLCLFVIAIIFVCVGIMNFSDRRNLSIIGLAVGICCFGLYHLSRIGHTKMASRILIGLMCFMAVGLLTELGGLLPVELLLIMVIITTTGLLLGARQGLIGSGLASITILGASYLQQIGQLQSGGRWLDEAFQVGDAISYDTAFVAVGLVSWLTNREIDHSLQRALASEKALASERDDLERRVFHRTQALQAEQLRRLVVLKRYAEIGQLHVNLLHEVANPLTAASLNLEQFDHGQSILVLQARKNLQHLERYVTAARHQIRGTNELTVFSIRRETEAILKMLGQRSHTASVKIVYRQAKSIKLYGDPVKFCRIITNLVVNSIDACTASTESTRPVEIFAYIHRGYVVLEIKDHGIGIAKDKLETIFEPFYTSKVPSSGNLGIGLAMVKSFVVEDFHGSINVKSSPNIGTIFTVRLKQTGHSQNYAQAKKFQPTILD